jgi:CBS domain-containing protein
MKERDGRKAMPVCRADLTLVDGVMTAAEFCVRADTRGEDGEEVAGPQRQPRLVVVEAGVLVGVVSAFDVLRGSACLFGPPG